MLIYQWVLCVFSGVVSTQNLLSSDLPRGLCDWHLAPSVTPAEFVIGLRLAFSTQCDTHWICDWLVTDI